VAAATGVNGGRRSGGGRTAATLAALHASCHHLPTLRAPLAAVKEEENALPFFATVEERRKGRLHFTTC